MFNRLEAIVKKYEEIKEELVKPEVLSDFNKLRELSKEESDLKETVDVYNEYKKVKDNLEQINAAQAHIITEPVGKNTAPAIALAISYCRDVLNCHEDEVLFVTPADHLIKPVDKFHNLTLNAAELCAANKAIVTIGVKPSKPETGYGYIESESGISKGAYKVTAFKEKPDEK